MSEMVEETTTPLLSSGSTLLTACGDDLSTEIATAVSALHECSSDDIPSTLWCVDSGSGRSIGNRRGFFTDLKTGTGHRMVFPNGESLTSRRTGIVDLKIINTSFDTHKTIINLTIEDCTLVEGFEENIISEYYLLKTLGYDLSVSPDANLKHYSKDGHQITARAINGIYYTVLRN